MQPSSASRATEGALHVSGSQSTQPKESVTFYHWLVVLLASCGWLFDCAGQRVFVLSREPALRELLGAGATDNAVRGWGVTATFLLMVGWATGGIVFGILSDRYGRVKTMITALLAYSIFSGLSGFAHSGIEFLLWRLLFGLGVGGMFGAATTLVAESVPPHFRTVALGALQALSAFGNMLASALSLGVVPGKENLWGHYSGWQVLAFISVLPALMAIPMALLLKEPESWRKAKHDAASGGAKRSVGSLGDMFSNPRWRKNLSVGVCLGVAGMVGLWGIAFFSPELVTTALKNRPLRPNQLLQPEAIVAALNRPATPAVERIKSGLSPALVAELARSSASQPSTGTISDLVKELNGLITGPSLYDAKAFPLDGLKKATQNLVTLVKDNGKRQNISFLNRQLIEQSFPGLIQEQQHFIDEMRSRGTLLQDVGSLLGMVAFTFVAARFSRRGAFLSAFILCFVVVAFVFSALRTATDVYWMLPLMGFATLSVFAGYSIYFPELFPTRLRGTGVGFCYNTVRYVAAPFPLLLGWLSTMLPFRTVAMVMCGIYFVGMAALIWAPETKGKPLPED